MKKIILIFFLLGSLSAQNYYKLFANEIPESFKSSTFNERVSNNLNLISQLSPDLYYYYFKKLESQVNRENPKIIKLYSEELSHLIQSVSEKKNTWIQNLIDSFNSMNVEKYAKIFITNILKEKIISNLNDEINVIGRNKTNQNKINYFFVKYNRSDPELKYDRNTKYKLLSDELKKEIINKFENMCGSNQFTADEIEPNMDWVIDNWFIIKDIEANEEKILSSFSKMARKYFTLEDEDLNNFEIFSTYSKNGLVKLTHKLNIKKYNFNFSSDIATENQMMGFGIGYKLRLRQQRTFFSFLRFQFIFQFKYDENSYEMVTNNLKLQQHEGTRVTDVQFYLRGQEIVVKNCKNLDLTFSIPVIYDVKNFSLELGAVTSFSFFDLIYKFGYTYRKIILTGGKWTDTIESENGYQDDSQNGVIEVDILPFIQLNYSTPWGLFFRSNVTKSYLSCSIGYEFNLF